MMAKNSSILMREPTEQDETQFLEAMHHSHELHHPWVNPPQTSKEFKDYIQRSKQENQKCFLLMTDTGKIASVFNLSEIVRGCFHSAYLGFYVILDYAGKGYMSAGLKLLCSKAFEELKLHRIEANIQPENIGSIKLVKYNGFKKEGYSPRYLKINDTWCDHERWAITYEDWLKR